MIRRWKRRERQSARPLSNRAITLGIVVVLGFAVAVFTALLRRYSGAGTDVELDAIRTAGALTVAAGGAATLLLAARRQAHTERDTGEQRITELYTRAVDQLGAEKAPVRLGGLHALERLAQNNPTQRQTIVDVICSYLRMPYTPPPDRPHVDSGVYRSPGPRRRRHRTLTDRTPASLTPMLRYQQAREEWQVRLTAQRILAAHLNPKAAAVYWANIDLNLTEAHLHQLDLSACHVRRVWFTGATFTGFAGFDNARFAEEAVFSRAEFGGYAGFDNARFVGDVVFSDARFTEKAWFFRAEFTGRYTNVEFGGARFAGDAVFSEARFTGRTAGPRFYGAEFTGRNAWFNDVTFSGNVYFTKAKFAGNAKFGGTLFGRDVFFAEAEFTENAKFDEAEFAGNVEFRGARMAPSSRPVFLPMGWTTRAAAKGEDEGWLYVVRDEDSSEQPAEAPDDGEGGSGGKTGT